jgi:hypothetical protein
MSSSPGNWIEPENQIARGILSEWILFNQGKPYQFYNQHTPDAIT